jgi:hypothetical protein
VQLLINHGVDPDIPCKYDGLTPIFRACWGEHQHHTDTVRQRMPSCARASCWLLAAGVPAAGCWLLAAGCWLLAAGCWLLAAMAAAWVCVLMADRLRAGQRAAPRGS